MSDRQQGVVSSYPQGDTRQIRVRPHVTDELLSDRGDILDLVRKRIEERKLRPIDIRKAGVSNWDREKHWRVRQGFYDVNISMKVAYQLAVAVGLKRTKVLPFAL